MSSTKSRSHSSNPARPKSSKRTRSCEIPNTTNYTPSPITNVTSWCTTRESWILSLSRPTPTGTSETLSYTQWKLMLSFGQFPSTTLSSVTVVCLLACWLGSSGRLFGLFSGLQKGTQRKYSSWTVICDCGILACLPSRDLTALMRNVLGSFLEISKGILISKGTLIQMEHSYYQKEHSYYQKEYSSSKWNTHPNGTLILSKGTLILSKGILIIKMEHSYYQKEILIMEHSSSQGTLILYQKWNTHHGTLIFSSRTLAFMTL